MCNLMICGTYKKKHVVRKNDQRIYCPYCMCMGNTTRMTDRTYCTFFFIPLIKCSESSEYTGCSQCQCKLGIGDVRACDDCHNVIFSSYDFCGRCGKRAEFPNTVGGQNSQPNTMREGNGHRDERRPELSAQSPSPSMNQNNEGQIHQVEEG